MLKKTLKISKRNKFRCYSSDHAITWNIIFYVIGNLLFPVLDIGFISIILIKTDTTFPAKEFNEILFANLFLMLTTLILNFTLLLSSLSCYDSFCLEKFSIILMLFSIIYSVCCSWISFAFKIQFFIWDNNAQFVKVMLIYSCFHIGFTTVFMGLIVFLSRKDLYDFLCTKKNITICSACYKTQIYIKYNQCKNFAIEKCLFCHAIDNKEIYKSKFMNFHKECMETYVQNNKIAELLRFFGTERWTINIRSISLYLQKMDAEIEIESLSFCCPERTHEIIFFFSQFQSNLPGILSIQPSFFNLKKTISENIENSLIKIDKNLTEKLILNIFFPYKPTISEEHRLEFSQKIIGKTLFFYMKDQETVYKFCNFNNKIKQAPFRNPFFICEDWFAIQISKNHAGIAIIKIWDLLDEENSCYKIHIKPLSKSHGYKTELLKQIFPGNIRINQNTILNYYKREIVIHGLNINKNYI